MPPPIVADATPGMPSVPLVAAFGVTVSVDAAPEVTVDGAAIQLRTASQRSLGASICDPNMWIKFSAPTMFRTRAVLPDFDGPEIEMGERGVATASCTRRSSFSSFLSTYVVVGKSLGTNISVAFITPQPSPPARTYPRPLPRPRAHRSPPSPPASGRSCPTLRSNCPWSRPSNIRWRGFRRSWRARRR